MHVRFGWTVYIAWSQKLKNGGFPAARVEATLKYHLEVEPLNSRRNKFDRKVENPGVKGKK